MSEFTVLVVGATGSIGRYAVAESLRRGYRTRALVRDAGRGASLPEAAEAIVGDLARAQTLAPAVDGVDGIVFTHGSHGGAAAAERVDYGAVRIILEALGGRRARIALMTAIGVTKHTPGHDWKRRGERLVRASGLPYTIVRPGWFDYNEPDQRRLVMLQGDRRWASNPSDGVVSRLQIAEVLVASLTSEVADRRTLELVAEHGWAQEDLDPLFAALQPDPIGSLDGVLDTHNMPLEGEPYVVARELELVRSRRR
ncbi:SDR family oxidoreductase [Arthrobacter sp. FW306-04-A]|uniref:SDR family oxidoreductase n=1 Tax=Arthrobacter sp. FW306-04-A TaxID=2879619 RepID=UPI0037C0F2F3|nr:SDR family oxidoreductase [Arthrobacter sp. FW306-04-A]